MSDIEREPKPFEVEMFTAHEVMRLGQIYLLSQMPSGVRPEIEAVMLPQRFDYAEAAIRYRTNAAFYQAAIRIGDTLAEARGKETDDV